MDDSQRPCAPKGRAQLSRCLQRVPADGGPPLHLHLSGLPMLPGGELQSHLDFMLIAQASSKCLPGHGLDTAWDRCCRSSSHY